MIVAPQAINPGNNYWDSSCDLLATFRPRDHELPPYAVIGISIFPAAA
jgi:hypothetical protein